jgi:cytochrome c-type protein NapC
MNSQSDPDLNKSRWSRFWRRPESKWLLGVPIGAWLMFAAGASSIVGAQVGMYLTATESFCAESCHSMKAYTTPEWQDSVHFANPSGVRSLCADCHIPKVYPQKLWAKAYDGVRHVWGEINGVIDTQEKYDARRAVLAERVWKQMKATDSRECRNCHNAKYFELSGQDERAARAHKEGPKEGKTCIDCHKGIAHWTPEEVAEEAAAEI